MGLYLRYLNRKQERRRVSLGLPAKLEDMSIMSTDDAAAYRSSLSQRLREQGFDEITSSQRLYACDSFLTLVESQRDTERHTKCGDSHVSISRMLDKPC